MRQHLQLMVNNHGKGGGLNPAERVGRTVAILWKACCNSGAVHANDPVGLGAGIRCITERLVGFPGFSVLEGLQHSVIRHRLHPHAGRRGFDLRMLNDGSENQFALPRSVTSVHDFRDRFVFHELQDGGELFFGSPALGFVLKRIRNVGQTIDRSAPIFERLIVVIHVLEFKQVADGPGDDDVVAVPVCICFFSNAKDVGKVLGNAGFLSNDDDGHMEKAHRRPYLNPPS